MSKKLIAIALAGLFVFSAVSVKADTISDLQAQITALMAQIAALQAQVTGAGTGLVCFNTDLKQGMTSDDVKNLQIKLGVSPTSGYFGPLTLAAVKKFQTSNGISSTGYVGPLTRAALNELYCKAVTPVTTYPEGCTSAVGYSTTTGLPCSTTVTYPEGCTSAVGFSPTTGLSCAGTTTTTVGPSYGTLSVVSYPVSNPQNPLYGGQTYEILDAQYKASGSDITLRKVAVEIFPNTSFPWSIFSTISVWDGSTKLAEVPVTQANLIQNWFGIDYTLNISGLNWVIPSGTQKILTVKATLPTAIPAKSGGGNYNYGFSLPLSGIVYADTAGVTYTSINADVGPITYNIAPITQYADFVVSVDSNNPIENNIIGSTSGTTKQTVLVFDVQNNTSINATFNSAYATTTLSANDAPVVSYELWDGTTLITSVGAIATTTPTVVYWQNFTLPIAANTTKVLTVKAVIAQLTTDYAGSKTVKVDSPLLVGIDANSNLIGADGNSITGNLQHIYYKAPSFAFTASSKSVTGSAPNSSPAHTNDIVDASITFTVTANNSDIYLVDATNTKDILTTTSTLSSNVTCNTPAVVGTTAKYRIPSGNTATCVVTSHWANTDATAGYAAVKLYEVVWNTLDYSTGTAQHYGFTTFKTDTFYLGK